MATTPPPAPYDPASQGQAPVAAPVAPAAPVGTPYAVAQPPAVVMVPEHEHQEARAQQRELIIYSHSSFFYWWPVWTVGYILALVTWLQGELVPIGENAQVYMHPSKNLGVFFTAVFLTVILFTNLVLRGKTSVIAILSVMFVTVLFAYLGWWETILGRLSLLAIYMNLGFYLAFSSAIFVPWLLVFFVYDRLHYWRVRPGQLTFESVIGAAARSYDTRGMIFEKAAEDIFRHWLLGFGSGDIRIVPSGRHDELRMTNVLFVDQKVRMIQNLLAVKPDAVADL